MVYTGKGLFVQCPGLKPVHVRWSLSVIERGGIRHLIDGQGNWLYSVFDKRAFIGTAQDHIYNDLLNKTD